MSKYQIEQVSIDNGFEWFVDAWVGDGWSNVAVLRTEDEARVLVAKLQGCRR